MSKKKKIVLIGGGGHCKVVIDAIKRDGKYEIRGIVDQKLQIGEKVAAVPVLGNDDVLPELFKKGAKNAFISVGSVSKEGCVFRGNLFEKIKKIGFDIPAVIHSSAIIAEDVKIGKGTFVAASVTVNPGAVVEDNVILNTSSSVDHDCRIGNSVHVAPGVTLSGNVEVGDNTHIGTGAVVTQNVKIGKYCMIGAGSRLSSNMGDNGNV